MATRLAGLDSTWTVYASPRIGLDRPDFIALHDRFGVCILDVLDWTPDTTRTSEAGSIELCRADGTWTPIAFDPRVVSSRRRSAIFDQFFAMPEDGGDPPTAIRSIIVLPAFTTAAADDLFARTGDDAIDVVGIAGGDALDTSISDVLRGAGSEPPSTASMNKLRCHIAAAPDLLEPKVWDLSTPPAIIGIAENRARRRHRRIEGVVGSGKSSALAARAARLAADGKQVLALSFNVTFANGLRSMIDGYCDEIGADPTLVTCANFHSFCTRVVADAEIVGAELASTRGAPWTVGIVEKTIDAYEQDLGPRFHAVMIDEGQDFTRPWWNLLNDHVLAEGGETLLTVDRTQDVYSRTGWLDDPDFVEAHGIETVELSTSLRLPADLLALTNQFATEHLDGALQLPVESIDGVPVASTTSVRRWGDVARVKDVGTAVGQEVVEILRSDPTLRPCDVAFVCDYHHDGVRASIVIERAGYPVHHIFSRNPDDPRRRRKHRFWTDADAVKGCTAHSLKGWDASAVVLGVGGDARARRLAYVAMTRVRHADDRRAIVSVVNADAALSPFGEAFVTGSAPLSAATPAPPAPTAAPARHTVPPPPMTPPAPITSPSMPPLQSSTKPPTS